MFKIQDGRNQFYQWDIDRRLIIEDASVTEVHFCNRTDNCSLVCEVFEEEGIRLVNVPNILLQTNWRINVYAYDSKYTKHSTVFQVVARTKPADYVYTETEIKNYATLEERITALEKNGGGGGTADLSDYYNKQEIDDKLANIDVADEIYIGSGEAPEDAVLYIDPNGNPTTGYATEEYVDDAIAAIELPSGGGGEAWDILMNVTTTEDVSSVGQTTPPEGHTFDEYDEVMFFVFVTPNTSDATLSITINIFGTNPYLGFHTTSLSGIKDGLGQMGMIHMKRYPFGWMVIDEKRSYNNGSINNNLAPQSNYVGYSMNYKPNTIPEDMTTILKNGSISAIGVGSYVKVLGAGSKILVYGKRGIKNETNN